MLCFEGLTRQILTAPPQIDLMELRQTYQNLACKPFKTQKFDQTNLNVLSMLQRRKKFAVHDSSKMVVHLPVSLINEFSLTDPFFS